VQMLWVIFPCFCTFFVDSFGISLRSDRVHLVKFPLAITRAHGRLIRGEGGDHIGV
jgi:hypothetical protein